ncbi:hypothetical protein KBB12_03110 [Candidatus Woesebacteria bacterium]|nr:hypothetical protein [Candidatus Woesebacteria bacterium]
MIRRLKHLFLAYFSSSCLFLFAFPASTNFSLRSFEFGSGGDYNLNSTNYSLEGLAGEVATDRQTSANYAANSGLQFVQMAHTPGAPVFTNDADWYDKLKIVLTTSNNPSDTTFAVAISDDDFVTTQYVQSDDTVGPTLAIGDFRTYAGWGSGTGTLIIGLDPDVTYKVKVKARQGKFTEGPWGPTASATTGGPTISMDIDILPTDSETAPPYEVAIGDLQAGTVTTASDKIWLDFETNAYNGGEVFVRDQYAGLLSAKTAFTISSATANLAATSIGYGLQGSSATQTSGGPFTLVTPYDGAGDNVGVVDTTFRTVLTSSAPLIGGRASLQTKAKITDTTPAAEDYVDTLTFIVSAVF